MEKELVKAELDRYEITEKGEEMRREIDKLSTLF
jgi:predicted transcriptional regulator